MRRHVCHHPPLANISHDMYDSSHCLHPKIEYLTPVNRHCTSKNISNSFVDTNKCCIFAGEINKQIRNDVV